MHSLAQAATAAGGGNAILLLVVTALVVVAVRTVSRKFEVVNRINSAIADVRQRRREALEPAMVAAFLVGGAVVLVYAVVFNGG